MKKKDKDNDIRGPIPERYFLVHSGEGMSIRSAVVKTPDPECIVAAEYIRSDLTSALHVIEIARLSEKAHRSFLRAKRYLRVGIAMIILSLLILGLAVLVAQEAFSQEYPSTKAIRENQERIHAFTGTRRGINSETIQTLLIGPNGVQTIFHIPVSSSGRYYVWSSGRVIDRGAYYESGDYQVHRSVIPAYEALQKPCRSQEEVEDVFREIDLRQLRIEVQRDE